LYSTETIVSLAVFIFPSLPGWCDASEECWEPDAGCYQDCSGSRICLYEGECSLLTISTSM